MGITYYNGEGENKIIDNQPTTALQNIFCTPGVEYSINSEFSSLYYLTDSLIFPSSVKDLFQYSNNTVFAATNNGIFRYGKDATFNTKLWTQISTRGVYKYDGISERCNAIVVDEKERSIYVGAQSGLLKVDSNGVKEYILHEDKQVFVTDLEFIDGKIWCATIKNGILVFEGKVLIQQYDVRNGLLFNQVNKLCRKDKILFVAYNGGSQWLNLESGKWQNIGISEGLLGERIHDICVSNDYFWLLTNRGLNSLSLEDLPVDYQIPEISVDSIIFSGKENVHWTDQQKFNYQTNYLRVYFDYYDIASKSQANIYYRIEELDQNWNIIPATKNLIEYKTLLPGKYSFEIKAKYGNTFSSVRVFPFKIISPYWLQWWFIPLIVLVTIVIISSYYWYRIKEVSRKNSEILQRQKIQSDLLEAELKALKSQMNPHFIFNSLNSIQDLILREKTEESYDYIVLFAELVRSTLSYSNHEFIPIQKELDFLNVYLSLEKLRFKDEFSYHIDYPGSTHINVPSLIVQPFIENALVHGLLHKEGHKSLRVEFTIEDHLICSVTDNGVGRKRSKEIKKRQGAQHRSFAIDAITKRLAILTTKYGNEVGFVIYDLYENGKASGTTVRLPCLSKKVVNRIL